jgi:HKD family nuclease
MAEQGRLAKPPFGALSSMPEEIIQNSRRPLLDFLREQAEDARSMSVAVAFVKSSGWGLIEDNVVRLLNRNGAMYLLFGLDFHTTEPRAIRAIAALRAQFPAQAQYLAFSDFRVRRDDTPMFHPKIYLYERPNRRLAFSVGSSNLTSGGLRSNVEVNLTAITPANAPLANQVSNIFQSLWTQPSTFEPDETAINQYEETYQAVQRRGADAARDPAIQKAVRELRQRAIRLRRTGTTQLDLVVGAVRELTQTQPYAQLSDIQRLVRQKATERGIEYDWESLDDSVRGRLNGNVMGKPYGRGLFERPDNRAGSGRYRLRQP